MDTPIIGRQVLKSFERDNIERLLVGEDKPRNDIDVAKRFVENGKEERNSGRIAALFGESIFNSRGIMKDDGLDK